MALPSGCVAGIGLGGARQVFEKQGLQDAVNPLGIEASGAYNRALDV